jgi:hypothetical protein
MRLSHLVPLVALAGALALGGASSALAARGEDGNRSDVAQRSSVSLAGPSPADKLQRALSACRDRGYRGALLTRCVNSVLAGADGSSASDGLGSGGQIQQPLSATTAPPQSGQGSGGGNQPVATPRTPAPAPAPAPPQPRGPVLSDQGIVQAAGSDVVVLRALDGSSITIPLTPATRVYVGNRPASISDIHPGGVATVRHQDGGPGLEVRVALPPKPKLRTDRAITTSATPTVLVVQLRDGTSVSMALDPATTRVQAPNGRPLATGDLAPGLLVDVLYDPSGTVPAQTVKIIRRIS